MVVDETMTVLQFRGRTAAYLEPAPGMASLDLFRMLREGLLAEVRAAVNQAKAENAAVVREGLRVAEGGQVRHGPASRSSRSRCRPPGCGSSWSCSRTCRRGRAAGRRPPSAAAADRPPTSRSPSSSRRSAALREYLQSVIEEQESTNEELKSANEEILSANEELQSTNEELQTAKEEAQSANEELATVNDELRHRNAELARVNNDLVNLLSGRQHPDRHGQPRPAHPPLHAAGREGVQPDPDRRRPADQRHQAEPARWTTWRG